jgi:hypothetical protein
MYYVNYVYKELCMVSNNVGRIWLTKILKGYWKWWVNMFMIDATTFQSMCYDLETWYRLKASRRMSVIEKVIMFLYILVLGALNRELQKIF